MGLPPKKKLATARDNSTATRRQKDRATAKGTLKVLIKSAMKTANIQSEGLPSCWDITNPPMLSRKVRIAVWKMGPRNEGRRIRKNTAILENPMV